MGHTSGKAQQPPRSTLRRRFLQCLLAGILSSVFALQIYLADTLFGGSKHEVAPTKRALVESLSQKRRRTPLFDSSTKEEILKRIEENFRCHGNDCSDDMMAVQEKKQHTRTQPVAKANTDDKSGTYTVKRNRRRRKPVRKKACICAIVKNEDRYIDEWVDYNLAIGFDKIYLFDNSDNYTLEDWAHNRTKQDRRITVTHFPGESSQLRAYRACVKSHARRNRLHWAAFLDADEFLVLKQHSNVIDFLEEHLESGQLSINGYTFGISNHTEYDPTPVTKRNLYRGASVDEHVKSIAVVNDMKRGIMLRSPHFVWTRNATQQKDTSGHIFHGPLNSNGPVDVAVIHHYRFKSTSEFREKGCVGADFAENTDCRLAAAPVGDIYDDAAWVAMKKYVPRYQSYDTTQ